MEPIIVSVPSIKEPIQPSPGFAKKHLSEFKLDLLGRCEFRCLYCSSDEGYYMRVNRRRFADLTEEQIGDRVLPAQEPGLMFVWPDVLDNLRKQLGSKPRHWGAGRTLVFSMLTDGFSPRLVKEGTTEKALRLVLENTAFRIRVLTKNSTVASDKWVEFFKSYPGRFVVGLSTGTLDDEWARRVEGGTSLPSARLRALAKLQRAGVPTFGMLCPIFPDVLEAGRVEELTDRVNPTAVENLWAEPYNDRNNWEVVRSSYPRGSFGYSWLTQVYEQGDGAAWSRYATEIYSRLRDKSVREGWESKLKFLLYENGIVAAHAAQYRDMRGLLLQSKPRPDGFSQNPLVAYYQRKLI